MKKLFILGVAAACLMLPSCGKDGSFLDSPRNTPDPFLTPESTTIEVEAAGFSVGEKINSNLKLSSNISWSSSLSSPEEWLEVSRTSDINLSGETKNYSIPVNFKDNADPAPREVTLSFSFNGGTSSVTILQKGFVPELRLEGQAAISDVPAKGGVYEVEIISNTQWTAAVAPGATAGIELGSTEGNRSGKLSFTVGENDQTEVTATASIVISATDCSDITIEITQNKAEL